jgi:hypothetical protein
MPAGDGALVNAERLVFGWAMILSLRGRVGGRGGSGLGTSHRGRAISELRGDPDRAAGREEPHHGGVIRLRATESAEWMEMYVEEIGGD